MPTLIRPRSLPVARRPLSDASWATLHAMDALLLQKDQRQQAGYAALRARLDSVPRAERGIDWTERLIALYGVFLMHGPRSGSLVRKIHAQREANGQLAELAAFEARLAQTLGNVSLTRHGFHIIFKDQNLDLAVQDLAEVVARIEALGYQTFLNSGTLLGAVRDKSFILHDDDVDLAVILPETTLKTALHSHYRLHEALAGAGLPGLKERLEGRSPVLKLLTENGLNVDLFPAWIENGQVYIWPHTFGELSAGDVLPLGQATINGIAFPAPKDPEKMLELNYGAGWRVPDPKFVFNWAGARERFWVMISRYRWHRRWNLLKKALKVTK